MHFAAPVISITRPPASSLSTEHTHTHTYTHADDARFPRELKTFFVWPGGLVVSALGMRTRRPRFECWVAPLFHWVATLGKLFTHTASPLSQLQETGVQKGVFGA